MQNRLFYCIIYLYMNMRVYIAKIQIIRFKHVLKPDTALKARKYSNYIPSTIKAVLCTDTIIDPILPAFIPIFSLHPADLISLYLIFILSLYLCSMCKVYHFIKIQKRWYLYIRCTIYTYI